MGDQDVKTVKQQLFESEARGWLKRGYNSAAGIEALREVLGKKRKKANIDALIEEMRRQWSRRAEWQREE